jgi:hypothetical protein
MGSISERAGYPVHHFAIIAAQFCRDAIAAKECPSILTEHFFNSSLNPGHGRFLPCFRGQRRESFSPRRQAASDRLDMRANAIRTPMGVDR